MTLQEFLESIDNDVASLLAPDFTINTIDTKFVPNDNDSSLTFENFDRKNKTCKYIETCVLFIDIRGSTQISNSHQAQTLAKLYSTFVSSMIKAGRFYGGHIRGIVGDRVMVVFDEENCCTNAVNTAILMNSIAKHILDKNNTIKCGIGIDYGNMLVTKTGIIRQGHENSNYKSLVWLGKPANIASKLTDLAGKVTKELKKVQVAYKKPSTLLGAALYGSNSNSDWLWQSMEMEEFINQLEAAYYPHCIKYKDQRIQSFYLEGDINDYTAPSILMTEKVYQEYKKQNPNDSAVKKNLWSKQNVTIPGHGSHVYGGNIIFTAVENIKEKVY